MTQRKEIIVISSSLSFAKGLDENETRDSLRHQGTLAFLEEKATNFADTKRSP